MNRIEIWETSATGDVVVETIRPEPPEFRRLRRVIYYIFDSIVLVITLRFFFAFLGANPVNGFVSFIHAISDPLIAPFRSITAPAIIGGGSVIEWAALFAILLYAIIAYLLVRLFRLLMV